MQAEGEYRETQDLETIFSSKGKGKGGEETKDELQSTQAEKERDLRRYKGREKSRS